MRDVSEAPPRQTMYANWGGKHHGYVTEATLRRILSTALTSGIFQQFPDSATPIGESPDFAEIHNRFTNLDLISEFSAHFNI